MDDTFHRAPDPVRVQRGLLVVFLMAVTLFGSSAALKSGNPVFMSAIIAIPLLMILLSHPVKSLYLGLLAFFSVLNIARLGTSITDADTLFSFAAISCFAPVFFRRSKVEAQSEDRLIGLFVLITLIIMIARGSGLKFLGSSTWGGSAYLLVFASALFYRFCRSLRLSGRGIVIVICAAVLIGAVNSIMQRAGFMIATEELTETGRVRLMWTTPFATALFPFALVIKWKKKWVMLCIWLAAFGLLGLSGFRSRLISQIVLVGAFFYFLSSNRRSYIVKALLAGSLFWIILLFVAPLLPEGLQRAVSFVPGIDVADIMARNAQSSTEWRFTIWTECLRQAPKYFLIGRGIAFNVWETVHNLGASDVQRQSQWFMFLTHSYHSGPMTLLVDYGIPGLIVMLMIHIAFIRKCFKIGKDIVFGNTHLSRFTCFFIALVVQQIFSFWFLFGRTDDLCSTIFSMGVVYIAHKSLIEESHEAAGETDPFPASEADSLQLV